MAAVAAPMPSAILYSALGNPKDGFPGYCASHPPDWTGTQCESWPGRHPEVYGPFRLGRLRAERLSDGRGRGLASGADVEAQEAVCAGQPPLSILQYSDSQSLCEVCAHCHRFCGSLATALRRCLEAAQAGTLEDYLPGDPELLADLEGPEWQIRGRAQRVPCENGCGAVFCSEECAEAARREGWHRILCVDLTEKQRQVWKCFQQYSVKYHEQFIAAARVIAEIICLVKYSGVELWEAMAYFSRFMKMSWLNMQNVPSMSTCQAGPLRGKLAALAQGRKERRQQVVLASLELLVAILWEEQWSEVLSLDFYSNLIGQFSLSNVWVQIEHPLNEQFEERCRSEEFRRSYRGLIQACQEAVQKVRAATEEPDQKNPEETAPSRKDSEEAFSLPRFEGSALYPCVALSNHSCQPNFTMRYADGCFADMVALRKIREGDELNLAYVSPSTPLPERISTLWRNWGFVCTCRRCQEEMMLRAMEGDKTRTEPDSEATAGYPNMGVQLSPAGLAAALAVRKARADTGTLSESQSSDDSRGDSEGEGSEEESSESVTSEEDAGVSRARNAPFSGPFGATQVPQSVKMLEAAMRDLVADIADQEAG
eukprot:s150_g23.t1